MSDTTLKIILYTGLTTIIFSVFALIGGFVWPYTINSWLVFFGKEPSIVFWQGALLGFCPFIGQASIPAAVITWILMIFLT